MSSLESTFSSSIHSVFKDRKSCVGTYRYLKNEKITEQYLQHRLYESCRQKAKDKRVLVACDTTDYNLHNHKNRITDFEGLGWRGDNSTIGVLQQAQLVIDREDKKGCLGWSGNYFFKRDKREKNPRRFRGTTPIEDKESYKWLGPSIESREKVLDTARHVLYIMDREADIYEVMSKVPKKNKSDVLIRMQQNRRLYNEKGEKVKLYEDLENKPIMGYVEIDLQGDRRKRKGRKA